MKKRSFFYLTDYLTTMQVLWIIDLGLIYSNHYIDFLVIPLFIINVLSFFIDFNKYKLS